MNGVLVGLAVAAVAVIVQRLLLQGHSGHLDHRETQFRFHKLRDRLQELAMQGKIERDSDTYEVTVWTLNIAIKNAEEMQLRDLIRLVNAVEEKRSKQGGIQFWRDVLEHDREVQELVGNTFGAFASTLVSNDPLVAAGVAAAALGRKWGQGLQRLISSIDRFVGRVDPTRAEAAELARRYTDYARRLSTSGSG